MSVAYRVTRTESRVAVGDWTMDLTKGQVVQAALVPDHVADHLINHGLLIECDSGDEDNLFYDSEDPVLADAGKAKSKSKK